MNSRKVVVAGSLICGLLLCFSSCINEDYSLDKEIDMTVQVGQNLSLPIGQADTIWLNQIIVTEDEEMLAENDGRYVIVEDGDITETIEGIDQIVVDQFNVNLSPYHRGFEINDEFDNLLPDDLEIEIGEGPFNIDASLPEDEGQFNIPIALPEEIEAITYVKLTDSNKKDVEVKFGIELTDIPYFIHELQLNDGEIGLPQVFDFEIEEKNEDELKYRKNGETIEIEHVTIPVKNGKAAIFIPIKMNGIADPEIDEDGNLILKDHLKFNIVFSVTKYDSQISIKDLKNIYVSIQPHFDLPTPQLLVTEVAGKLNPDDFDLNTDISLADIPDILKEEGTVIGLKDFSLGLDITNPVGIPIKAELVLHARDAQGSEIGEPVKLALEVEPLGTTKFNINESSEVIQSGSLTDLLSTIPDNVYLEVTQLVIESKTPEQRLVLSGKGNDYQFDIAYDLEVPLEFDNLHISYSDDVAGLQEDLSEITEWIDCLDLLVTVKNTIPMNIKLDLVPYDASGNIIEGIVLPKAITVAAAPCPVTGSNKLEENISNIEIKLSETRTGALKELDRLHIVAVGENAKGQGVVLRSDEYILLNLSVRLPKGVTVDLNEL